MEVSVSGQFYVFWMMLFGGVLSGVLSDVFFVLRRGFGTKGLTTGIADLALWAMLAGGIFFLNFTVNSGELRWHTLIGLFLGAILYFLTLSALVRRILGWTFAFLKKIVLLILKIVLTIAAFLYKIIRGIFLFFARLFAPIGRGARRAGTSLKRSFKGMKLVIKKK